jgi:hypothetical protein
MKPTVSLLFFLLLLSLSVLGRMQILNRSFELAAEPSTPYFIPPLWWEYENYAGIHTGPFEPNNLNSNLRKWNEIPSRGDGNFYLILSTGDLGLGSDRLIKKSHVSQRLYLPAKTLIEGAYFFGTCDYRPYYDFGAIELRPAPCDPNNPNDPNNPCDPNAPNYYGNLTPIQLARCSVSEVGDFGSTGHWISFSRIISPDEEGSYNLTLSVEDGSDQIIESYFAVDDLRICGPGVLPGDLCPDCIVDLQDFSLFSKEWLEICPIDPNIPKDPNDPNVPIDPSDITIIDPNCLCIYADFSKDGKVDVNDLDIFKDDWLQDNINL